jgi:predicted MPP superfamily phosphohydrolase
VTGRITRRKFVGIAAASAAAAVAGEGLGWEPYHPNLVDLQLKFPHWPTALDGFRIVQLSDLHYDPHFGTAPIQAAVRLANEQSADLIALTGDFVTLPIIENRPNRKRAAEQIDPCAALLKQLKSRYGAFAVLGNHDEFSAPNIVTKGLQGQGIEVLRNRSLPIEHNGARFFLAGVNDVLGGEADLDRALTGVSTTDPVVLLAHEPDFADDTARYSVGLQLSGHSHGGQIRIPFLWPLFLPALSHRYPKGLYKVGGLTLYTNVGVGTIHIPMRLNCPPEVTLITLRCGDGARA